MNKTIGLALGLIFAGSAMASNNPDWCGTGEPQITPEQLVLPMNWCRTGQPVSPRTQRLFDLEAENEQLRVQLARTPASSLHDAALIASLITQVKSLEGGIMELAKRATAMEQNNQARIARLEQQLENYMETDAGQKKTRKDNSPGSPFQDGP